MNLFKQLRVISILIIFKYSYSSIIIDVNDLANDNHFTKVKILKCIDLYNNFSDYLVHDHLYFVQDNSYYALDYNIRTEVPEGPFFLPKYLVEVLNPTNRFKYFICRSIDNTLLFENGIPFPRFKLESIFFLKPIDSFVQPPELNSYERISDITSCDDFDKNVIRDIETGTIIYKNKYQGNYSKQCLFSGCIPSLYKYSTNSTGSFFNWDKGNAVYDKCEARRLLYNYYNNGENYKFNLYLPNLIFYKPKPLTLNNLQDRLTLKLLSCKDFHEYWGNYANTLNNHIYFSYLEKDQLSYFAIKYNEKGAENHFSSIELVKLIKCEESRYGFHLILNLVGKSKEKKYFKLDQLLFYQGESSLMATELHKERMGKDITTVVRYKKDSKTDQHDIEIIDQSQVNPRDYP